jgi:hypothetical protein
MEIVYRAFDGKIFENEDECGRYEDSLVVEDIYALYIVNKGSIVTEKGRITKASTMADIVAVSKAATLIYFPTFAARDAFCIICDSRDITADKESMCVGWNYYSEDICDWVPLVNVDSLDNNVRDDVVFNRIVKWCDDLYNEYAREGKI